MDRTEVVDLPRQQRESRSDLLLGALQGGRDVFGERGEIVSMRFLDRRAFAARLELLVRELPQRLEEFVSGLADVVPAHLEQAVLDKVRERVERLRAEVADGLGGPEPAAAPEDGEAAEQDALALVEQSVAPRDRVAQRPLARRLVGGAVGEQVERMREPLQHRLGREDTDTRRCELDRERQTVEATTDLVHGSGVRVAERKVCADAARALREQLRRRGRIERLDSELVLTLESQRGAAGDEDTEVRARGQQTRDITSGRQEMLEVVEHEQRPRRDEATHHAVEQGAGGIGDAERLCNRGDHEARLGHGSELDEEDPVGERVKQAMTRCPQREPRLTRAADAGERHEPDVRPGHQLAEFVELIVAADEGVHLGGQVAGTRVRVGRERRILREDLAVELLQLRTRFESELVDKRAADRSVVLERFCLTARAVERQHQLAVDTLPQRIRGRELLQLRDELAVAAERELGVESLLERRQPQLLQTRDLRLGKRLVAEVLQRLATEQRQRLGCELRAPRRLRLRSTLGQPVLEAPDVEVRRCERE